MITTNVHDGAEIDNIFLNLVWVYPKKINVSSVQILFVYTQTASSTHILFNIPVIVTWQTSKLSIYLIINIVTNIKTVFLNKGIQTKAIYRIIWYSV